MPVTIISGVRAASSIPSVQCSAAPSFALATVSFGSAAPRARRRSATARRRARRLFLLDPWPHPRRRRRPRPPRPVAWTGMAPLPTAGICEDDDELRGGACATRSSATGFDGARDRVRRARRSRCFGADPPDVLVLDIGLPDADGRDVCQALRARGVRRAGAVPHRARRADRPAERVPRRRRRLPDQAVRARRAARPRARAAAARARPRRAARRRRRCVLDPAAHADRRRRRRRSR